MVQKGNCCVFFVVVEVFLLLLFTFNPHKYLFIVCTLLYVYEMYFTLHFRIREYKEISFSTPQKKKKRKFFIRILNKRAK